MKKLRDRDLQQAYSIKVSDGVNVWGMGASKLRKLAEEAGALRHVGRSVLIIVPIMNHYLDELSE